MNTTKTIRQAINDGDTITFKVHCDTEVTKWSESGMMRLEWNGQTNIAIAIDLATEEGLNSAVATGCWYTFGAPVTLDQSDPYQYARLIPFDHIGGWDGFQPRHTQIRFIKKTAVAKKAVRAAIQAWYAKGQINTTEVKFIIKF